MESFGLLIGGSGLLICLVFLWCRFYSFKSCTFQNRFWIFKIYLVLTVALGVSLMIVGGVAVSDLLDIGIALWMFSWFLVSALSTFSAPTRWSIVPVGYISLIVLYFGFSLLTGDKFAPPRPRPSYETIALGATIATIATWSLFVTRSPQVVEKIEAPAKS